MENTLVIVDQPAESAATSLSSQPTSLARVGATGACSTAGAKNALGLGALAASPEVVCGFLADEATRGRRASTLEGAWRRSRGLPPGCRARVPTGDEKVTVLSGIRRTIGAAAVARLPSPVR